ncbi:uncharacterized protein METZ01_LOCUS240636, partial [marine metagenome]
MSNGNRGTRPPALLFAVTCLLLLVTLVLFSADGLDFGLPFTDRSG